jgi:chemotaxis protein methyltransferase CheR
LSIQKPIELSDGNFAKLQQIIHDTTGITIADGRKSMLLSRLRGRLRDMNETDFKSYISRVTSDTDELQEMINRVTTNKTLFYRTPRVWEHFVTTAVAGFVDRNPGRPMRIWSAAASTGEEAYTAGMVLETVRQTQDGFDYKIVGSDISSRVLGEAETGCYGPDRVANFRKSHPELFQTHMLGDDTAGYRVRPQIKSRVSFRPHNLQNRMTHAGPFDAVFLRNVLIYFTPKDQEIILDHVHSVMHSDGVLYIGESESLSRLTTKFEMVEPIIYASSSKAGRWDA